MTVHHTASQQSLAPDRTAGGKMTPAPQIRFSSDSDSQRVCANLYPTPEGSPSSSVETSFIHPARTEFQHKEKDREHDDMNVSPTKQSLSLPDKPRSRHVSFEEDMKDFDISEDICQAEGHNNHVGILKPPSHLPRVDLVRNEYSDSPKFVRKHQVEEFRCSGVRMSITSLSAPDTKRESRLSSASSLGSYTCLPAVTKAPSFENHRLSMISNQPVTMRPRQRSRQRRQLYGDRKMSAFEVIVQEMAKRKESCQQRFCQIYVLLVILQISLGLAISTMALYLSMTSSTILYRDATIWSGVPLALAGVVGLCYHMLYTSSLKTRTTKASIHCVIFISSSALCIALCTLGCVTSGIHGTNIANYHHPCEQVQQFCICHRHPISKEHIPQTNLTLNKYHQDVAIFDFSSCDSVYGCCDLVFTNIKDCLLLECAFNCIGACISIWLIRIQWKGRPRGGRSDHRYSINENYIPHSIYDNNRPSLTQA